MDYLILGFQTADIDSGCDAERTADTLKEAKRKARYMLTEAYRRDSESDAVLVVVQIWKDGVVVWDRRA